jgi:hypothetical protein
MATTPYPCRWNLCPHTFPTLPELRHHFVHDHIPAEGALYVPSHKRRRRDDGGWELVEAGSNTKKSAQPAMMGASFVGISPMAMPAIPNMPLPLDMDISDPSFGMTMTTMTMSEPSFAVPSLPAAFGYSQEEHMPEHVNVNFGAYLRSPSPERMHSTPISQVPPESQGTNPSQAASASAANTSASSAQLVSPPRGRVMTQAIPPPSASLPTATPSAAGSSQCSQGSAAEPIQIGFGTAKAKVGTPGRKVSASGFSWGMGP